MNLSDPSHPVWNMGNDYSKNAYELIYSIDELVHNERYAKEMEGKLLFEQSDIWLKVKEKRKLLQTK